MATFYVLLYRMYFALKNSGVEGWVRRWPHVGRGLDQFKGLIQRHLWLRVQSGLVSRNVDAAPSPRRSGVLAWDA